MSLRNFICPDTEMPCERPECRRDHCLLQIESIAYQNKIKAIIKAQKEARGIYIIDDGTTPEDYGI